MIADFMQKCDMPYALSVFLPECGLSHEILTKEEVVEVLRIQSSRSQLPSPILLDIVEEIKEGTSIRPNMVAEGVQTEVGESGLSLDEKLKRLDYGHMDRLEAERIMPFKALEEKMNKYKRECDRKY